MQAQAIVDSVFCGISILCSVVQCLLIIHLVKRNGWVFSIFLQLNLAMAVVITANRSISYLDIFFTSLPYHVRESQVFVRIMYGFLDISFLPFAYFFLITAFSIDLMLNFALHYRSARLLHHIYIPLSLFIACIISMPILAWPGRLGENHLYIVYGNWSQRHYHIITLSMVIVICTLASVALVGAGVWRTIREWRGLRREINELVLPMSDSSSQSLDIANGSCGSTRFLSMNNMRSNTASSPESLDRLYYGRKVSRSIYYLAMYPLINLLAHLATGIGQIVVYTYPDAKWSRSVRDYSNDSVGILLLIVFISNPAFVESKFRRGRRPPAPPAMLAY
ncbi:hypothetical protein GGI25_000065 [Coemansia spiralis]|uniref:G protein-coupled receptor n=2 Tax=Coemansia TaxID=4863 RepID=A0A9W8G838_9FUNG|nr:hypothetical protein BX070DRAFT_249732 [Coemansia spiralis]KAJ1992564.1 hypothetical protein EDC05_002710 [Coemansia umbellata]KAJ2623056.1 hypothetical protein GGI26_002665 [Coemansia sp. RSA 1358]KAJ2681110.1 hypothetical protein GGI25_000065 [Coemansia spiralis]